MTVRNFIGKALTVLVSASLLASCGGIKGEGETVSGATVTLSGYTSGTTLSKPSTGDTPSMAAVPGAVVQILTMDGILVATTTTDSNGRYTVDVTKGENYIVRVSRGNVVLKAVVVTPGANTTVNVTPRSSAIVRVLADNLGNSGLGEINVDVTGSVSQVDLDVLISVIVAHVAFDDLVTVIETEISTDGDYDDNSGDTVGDGSSYPDITIIIVVIGGDGGNDTTPPSAPAVTGTTPTSDTTPIWSWTSGGGGNGIFRYKLNDADLTSGATYTVELFYTPSSPLSDGDHTLYVQERDGAGNWSSTGSKALTVDIKSLEWGTLNATAFAPGRSRHRTLVFNEKLYMVGGRNHIDLPFPYLTGEVWTSTNGTDWNLITDSLSVGSYGFSVVAFNNQLWIVGGVGNKHTYSSEDGIAWKDVGESSFGERYYHSSLVFDGKMWIFGGNKGHGTNGGSDVHYSDDGINWIETTGDGGFGFVESGQAVVFNNKIWVNGTKGMFYSDDGVSWDKAPNFNSQSSGSNSIKTVVYEDKIIVIQGLATPFGHVYSSSDGINWKKFVTKNLDRQSFTTTVFNGKILTIGGMRGDTIYSDVLYLLDTSML